MFGHWCRMSSRALAALGAGLVWGVSGMIGADNPRKGITEMKKHLLIVLFALLFVPLLSHAQGLASVAGRVTDPSGAAVASAEVIATQEGTGYSRTAVTDAEGLYVIPSLQVLYQQHLQKTRRGVKQGRWRFFSLTNNLQLKTYNRSNPANAR